MVRYRPQILQHNIHRCCWPWASAASGCQDSLQRKEGSESSHETIAKRWHELFSIALQPFWSVCEPHGPTSPSWLPAPHAASTHHRQLPHLMGPSCQFSLRPKNFFRNIVGNPSVVQLLYRRSKIVAALPAWLCSIIPCGSNVVAKQYLEIVRRWNAECSHWKSPEAFVFFSILWNSDLKFGLLNPKLIWGEHFYHLILSSMSTRARLSSIAKVH